MPETRENMTKPGPTVREVLADPLLAPPESMPASPLLRDERPPLRPPLAELLPSATGRRMENLDALRVLAMFVIVVTHVTQPYLDHLQEARPYGGLYQSIFSVNVACRFGVPCFLMISFYIYWHQLYEKGRTWGELLVRRFKRLVPAFLVWSLFYFALHKFLEPRGLNVDPGPLGSRLNWKDPGVWREILLLGRAHEHLYFLPVVMCSLLLIPLMAVLWRSAARAWTWIGVTLVAWSVVAYGVAFAPEGSGAGRAVGAVMAVWKNFMALPLLLFPLIGMMSAGQPRWREWIVRRPTSFWVGMAAFGVALHVAETLVMLNFGTTDSAWVQALAGCKVGRFVTAVPIFVLFLRRPLMRDPFPTVSHYAFGLHFMHPAVIIGLLIVQAKVLPASVASWEAWVVPMLVVNLVLTLAITYGLCLVVGRVKRLQFLVV
jgi:peptidoglycan/LPS O-acetylase OafA/YrhL